MKQQRVTLLLLSIMLAGCHSSKQTTEAVTHHLKDSLISQSKLNLNYNDTLTITIQTFQAGDSQPSEKKVITATRSTAIKHAADQTVIRNSHQQDTAVATTATTRASIPAIQSTEFATYARTIILIIVTLIIFQICAKSMQL